MSGAVAVFININMLCRATVDSGCDVITPLKHQFSQASFSFLQPCHHFAVFAALLCICQSHIKSQSNNNDQLPVTRCVPYSGSGFISSMTECWNYLSRCIFLTCSLSQLHYWQSWWRIYGLRAAWRCTFAVPSFTFNVINSTSYCDCGARHVDSNLCRLPG